MTQPNSLPKNLSWHIHSKIPAILQAYNHVFTFVAGVLYVHKTFKGLCLPPEALHFYLD
jgi:hypothetical protein